MVELRGVSFGYQSDKNVLDNLNLRLKEGRFYGLLGNERLRQDHTLETDCW